MMTLMFNALLRLYKTLFCIFIFFITGLLYSQSSSHADSVIFITKGTYLYIDSTASIAVSHIDHKTPRKDVHKKTVKAFTKVFPKKALPKYSSENHKISVSCNYQKSPENRYGFGNPGSTQSLGILDHYSSKKQQHKMTGSVFRIFLGIFCVENKLLYSFTEVFHSLEINILYFTRPPPNNSSDFV